ncbi:SIMPL domain-containing protein [Patescibacteria group bacterium]|nr:SIMPL domain-containing protein [Patescibacteria group bacterium]
MEEETKKIELSNRLFNLAVVIILIVVLSVIGGLVYKFKTIPGNTPQELSVSGEGKVYVIPDLATIDLSMVNEGKDIQDIIKKNTEAMNGLIGDIKGLGIDEKDIKTTQYNLAPQYNWTEDKGQIFIGYKLTNTILVSIRDFTKIGDVLAKANDRGTNLIGNISFSIEYLEKAQQEARIQAIKKAKQKAEDIAKSSGIKLGKLINVQDSYSPRYYDSVYKSEVAQLGGGVVPTPQIQSGQQEVDSTVILIYRVK